MLYKILTSWYENQKNSVGCENGQQTSRDLMETVSTSNQAGAIIAEPSTWAQYLAACKVHFSPDIAVSTLLM